MTVVGETPIVVFDDDPTGAQALAGVPVLLEWGAHAIRRVGAGRRSMHLLTNARALPPERAYELVRDAAAAAREAFPTARLILRGDSTLRGHLREEYLGVCDGALEGRRPPLLLAPALPDAGRVTLDGVHYLVRSGERTPLHRTEYAQDGVFSYTDARLLSWAEERSAGLFAASAGREVPLAVLRARGGNAVTEALRDLAASEAPGVCVPDAEHNDDLAHVAAGLDAALAEGLEVAVRSAPAFVGVWSGTTASGFVEPPAARDGVLVVCGSYVPTTTRQLERLARTFPGAFVEVDARALAGSEGREIGRAAKLVDSLLEERQLAVLTTPRQRLSELRTLAAGERVAEGLARIVAALHCAPDVLVAKGGITSAVTLRLGVGAIEAEVVGPLLPGVSLWHPAGPRSCSYVIVPGNVGDDELLVEVITRVLQAC